MIPDINEAKKEIKKKIQEVAKEQGNDASEMNYDQIIPDTGLLDSAGLMMLIVWFEDRYAVSTEKEDLRMDNFGTINLMVDYLIRNLDQ